MAGIGLALRSVAFLDLLPCPDIPFVLSRLVQSPSVTLSQFGLFLFSELRDLAKFACDSLSLSLESEMSSVFVSVYVGVTPVM